MIYMKSIVSSLLNEHTRTMKKLLAITILTTTLFSCSEELKDLEPFMVDLSEFTLNDTILKDGDYVQILGSSGNLTEEHKIDFYNLVVVKSERTGDTVNVLVTNFFMADLNDPRTQFLSNASFGGKVVENFENLKEIDDFKINDVKAKTYNKVLYDSEYIQVDVREYPAITGNLGWTITTSNSTDDSEIDK